MIANTIEEVKDFVEELEIDQQMKLKLQRMLTAVRSELLKLDSQVVESYARQNVYAEVCEKMFEKYLNRTDSRLEP